MRIGELSRRSGVSVHTIRYYESLGLIRGEVSDEGLKVKHRQYEEVHVRMLRAIAEAKKAGFTLVQMKTLLLDWFDQKMTREAKLDLLSRKLSEVETRIRELEQIREFLLQSSIAIGEGLC